MVSVDDWLWRQPRLADCIRIVSGLCCDYNWLDGSAAGCFNAHDMTTTYEGFGRHQAVAAGPAWTQHWPLWIVEVVSLTLSVVQYAESKQSCSRCRVRSGDCRVWGWWQQSASFVQCVYGSQAVSDHLWVLPAVGAVGMASTWCPAWLNRLVNGICPLMPS